MRNELWFKVNGVWVDAYTAYGVSFGDGGLSELMKPCGMKDPIQNANMAMHGTSIVGAVNLMSVRQISVPLYITSRTREEFWRCYDRFCGLLSGGWLHVGTRYQGTVVRHENVVDDATVVSYTFSPSVVYHLRYVDCTQFAEWQESVGKFVLTLEEPNPSFRS